MNVVAHSNIAGSGDVWVWVVASVVMFVAVMSISYLWHRVSRDRVADKAAAAREEQRDMKVRETEITTRSGDDG